MIMSRVIEGGSDVLFNSFLKNQLVFDFNYFNLSLNIKAKYNYAHFFLYNIFNS